MVKIQWFNAALFAVTLVLTLLYAHYLWPRGADPGPKLLALVAYTMGVLPCAIIQLGAPRP